MGGAIGQTTNDFCTDLPVVICSTQKPSHCSDGMGQRQDGVARALSRAERWEQESVTAGVGLKLLDDFHGLAGEGDDVRFLHLHSMGRDPPFLAIQIKFRPFRRPQLVRAYEDQRRQLKCTRGRVLAGVPINRAQ